MAKKNVGLIRTLVILGCIVAIIESGLSIVYNHDPLRIILAIVNIVLAIILLGSVGAIHTKIKLEAHWLITLLFGIIFVWLLTSLWGGIILIVAAIVEIIYAIT